MTKEKLIYDPVEASKVDASVPPGEALPVAFAKSTVIEPAKKEEPPKPAKKPPKVVAVPGKLPSDDPVTGLKPCWRVVETKRAQVRGHSQVLHAGKVINENNYGSAVVASLREQGVLLEEVKE